MRVFPSGTQLQRESIPLRLAQYSKQLVLTKPSTRAVAVQLAGGDFEHIDNIVGLMTRGRRSRTRRSATTSCRFCCSTSTATATCASDSCCGELLRLNSRRAGTLTRCQLSGNSTTHLVVLPCTQLRHTFIGMEIVTAEIISFSYVYVKVNQGQEAWDCGHGQSRRP